jgi:hypothetical protein
LSPPSLSPPIFLAVTRITPGVCFFSLPSLHSSSLSSFSMTESRDPCRFLSPAFPSVTLELCSRLLLLHLTLLSLLSSSFSTKLPPPSAFRIPLSYRDSVLAPRKFPRVQPTSHTLLEIFIFTRTRILTPLSTSYTTFFRHPCYGSYASNSLFPLFCFFRLSQRSSDAHVA